MNFFNFPTLTFLFAICFLISAPVHSQEKKNGDTIAPLNENMQEDRISIFIDCNTCDNSYLRQEIGFVDHVRDPQLAQVHLFITAQRAASGGRIFSLSFIGKEDYAEVKNNLTYTSLSTNTRDEEREGLKSMIELGLVSYLAHTSLAGQISLNIPEDIEPTERVNKDPWNNWVFQIYGGANFYKESSKGSLDLRYGAYADYVTPDWRIRLRPYFNYNQDDYIKDGEEVRSVRHRNGFEGRVVKSISDHWSVGVFPYLISNTYENIEFGYRVAPALEYSLLPYRLALRKEYTIAYSVGYLYRDYLEETIYGEMEETLYNHSLNLGVRVLQPWGTIWGGLEGSHYLHDPGKNRISLDTNISVRIFKGFQVDLSADYDYVQDQLSLPRGDASLEEVLLGQKQLATSYGISFAVGLSYRFGSIYNNVVNTRL